MIEYTTILVRNDDVIIMCDSHEHAKKTASWLENLSEDVDYREKYRQTRQIIKEWWNVDGFLPDDLMSRIEKILRYDEDLDTDVKMDC